MSRIFQNIWMILLCIILVSLPRFNRNQIWLKRPQADLPIHTAMVDYFRTGTVDEILLSKHSVAANWRPLFPLIASFLPFTSLTSLSILGILSLFFAAILLLQIMNQLGISYKVKWKSIYLFIFSFPAFYYTTIGYVDPGLILFITFGLYLALIGKFFFFLIIIATGVLMKEGIIVLIPFFLAHLVSIGTQRWQLIYWGLLCTGIYISITILGRYLALNAAQEHHLFWQPSIKMFIYNLTRPNSWLSIILTLGFPGGIIIKRFSSLKQISQSSKNVMPLICGILAALATYLFAFISTVADGRTIWAAYPFLIPLTGLVLDLKKE